MWRILVGLDFKSGDERLPGASGRVIGKRMYGNAGRYGFAEAAGIGSSRAVGRFPWSAFGKALRFVAAFGGEAPKGQVGARQRRFLGDVLRS